MKIFLPIIFCMAILIYLPAISHSENNQENEFQNSLTELLNTKIITASKYDQTISEIPASVTIITNEDIESYGYDNLADVLNRVVGFYISYDRNYYYLGTRGFSRPTDYNNRIKFLVDGQSTNDNFYGSASIGADFVIDLDAVERIEIVKGPGSVIYGTGAMFAVINVITKNTYSFEGLNISSEIGSFGRKSSSIFYTKEISYRSRLSLSGVFIDEEGQDIYFPEYNQLSTNYGIAEGKDWSEYKGFQGKYEKNDFTLSGYYGRGKKGIPTGVYDTDFNTDKTFTIDESSFLNAGYTWRTSPNVAVGLKAFYNHYYYFGSYPYSDFLTYDANWGDWYGSNLQLNWDVNLKNRLTVGTEFQKNHKAAYKYWDEDDEIYFDDDFPSTVYSLFFQNEYQAFQNLSITAGIRYDKYSLTEDFLTPRAAIVYHPGKNTALKLLYGTAFRSPSVYELFYEDSYYGYISNQSLKSEKINTAEIILEQQLNECHFSRISLYEYDMENLIDYYEDTSAGTFQYQNIGEVTSYGIEVDLQGRYQNGLNWFVNYSHEKTKETHTDEVLSNSPADIYKSGLSTKVGRYFTVKPMPTMKTKESLSMTQKQSHMFW